ncbi:TlpA family protein disulfide reductase [Candidatus Pelagibacter sp.]|nr:TlpA family protein disulfide reductase [Candidatus Pelagibacter sp.]
MKTIFFNYLIIIFYLISSSVSYSIELPEIKNLIVHKDKKKIKNIEFVKSEGQKVSLNNYKSNPLIINFWATWCAPCKKEMPSLDKLKKLDDFKNINIIPINIGGGSYKKSKEFFDEYKIRNLEIFTGSGPDFSQLFKLRGLPTTILIDRNGFEVGRIVGYVDFGDQNLLDWIIKNL